MPAFTINLCQTRFQHHTKECRSFPTGLEWGAWDPPLTQRALSSAQQLSHAVYRFVPFSLHSVCSYLPQPHPAHSPFLPLWPDGFYILRIPQSGSQLSLTQQPATLYPAPSSAHFLGHWQPQTTPTAATTLSRPKSLARSLHFCLALPETCHLAAGPQKSTNLG